MNTPTPPEGYDSWLELHDKLSSLNAEEGHAIIVKLRTSFKIVHIYAFQELLSARLNENEYLTVRDSLLPGGGYRRANVHIVEKLSKTVRKD